MVTAVITGFGAVTPLGNDAPTTWRNLVAGVSGIRPLNTDWAADIAVRFAGQVTVAVDEKLDRTQARRLDRVSQLSLIAYQEAFRDSGLTVGGYDPERTAVCFGTGVGGVQSMLTQWEVMRERGPRRVSPFAIPMLMGNAPAAHIGLALSARGAVRTNVSACASSSDALATALDTIRLGRADVVIVGGAEAPLHPFTITGFAQMQALSTRNDDPAGASRPWDITRDGFVMSEGAIVLVVESLSHAQSRDARIYASVAGAGVTADSYDLVQPDPSGRGQIQAMRLAIADAELTPADIVHVNAHATSTPAGDMVEAAAIRGALGNAADQVVVTGTKSMTGHLLGAAGALETFATAMALHTRTVPPTINLATPEPGLDIDVAITGRTLPSGPLAALNNSFGFGGHNTAIVLTDQHATRS
ncbi:MAG: beta-ketoacyl-[acyl-carrier-protein] synthase family protein [Propionibacteriaceae bacterium]|nr:beta-ketoacyl-[acyl-carrier-protein] synthase family protein [Propionibacteriaceae bacterium]